MSFAGESRRAANGAQRPPVEVLEYYTGQSVCSSPGRWVHLLDPLSAAPGEVARTVQGLAIHEWVAEPFYGVSIPDDRREESHLRTAEAMLDMIQALDGRSMTEAREPRCRLVGICRHFMLLAVAILRHHSVPARGRGGFGDYFGTGKHEDHWVCEYWDASAGRWKLLDAQFDEAFVGALGITHDITDVPRDRFLTAAAAWQACRTDGAEPADFGIETTGKRGLWFIAGSLIRDLATLNKVEVLPWDVWGAQPSPDTELSSDALAFFDELAALLADPDAHHNEIRGRFATESDLTVPATVFNSLLHRRDRMPQEG